MTSQLRKDLISGRWVIIAAERGKRPDEFRPAPQVRKEAPSPGFCPFCPGNESKTPAEIFAVRDERTAADGPGWRVRVVLNKFPALTRGAPPRKQVHGIFEFMDGIGVHEVIIESPDHGRELNDLPVDHVRDVLWTWQQRLKSIETETQYQYIQLFKNKGREAGASLSHPHSQILALPIIPRGVKEEIYSAERFFNRTKECIFCRSVREDREAQERVVLINGHFAVLAPFASRFPFEMRIHPLRHAPSFSSAREEELSSLAAILKIVLAKLKAVVFDPPYNIVLHQAPQPDLARKAWPQIERIFHWYLEILPVLTHIAGFEWGTGFYINPVPPEGAAKFLREQPVAGDAP
jgi:UDPglucose--hexose-1-phosphate uridylyltransferase